MLLLLLLLLFVVTTNDDANADVLVVLFVLSCGGIAIEVTVWLMFLFMLFQ